MVFIITYDSVDYIVVNVSSRETAIDTWRQDYEFGEDQWPVKIHQTTGISAYRLQ